VLRVTVAAANTVCGREELAPPDPTATIFDVQRFSVHDGPGTRTTVFFKGCPLRCAWCQNPESIAPRPQLLLYPAVCARCGACVAECDALKTCLEGGRLAAPAEGRPDECRDCGLCARACPTLARRLAGRTVTVAQLLDEALRDRVFYGRNGGVTFGGGEPLAQWPFARALAGALRREGVHVALDTACVAPPDIVAGIPGRFDLLIADLKAVTPEKHLEWTGGDNAAILDAIRALAVSMKERLWISVPLVPGVHDRAELEAMADFVASLGGPPPVRFIPYHRLGDSKYEALGERAPAIEGDVGALVSAARALFQARGIRILEQ
jgi:pyruvate formate lyase activating enzyme